MEHFEAAAGLKEIFTRELIKSLSEVFPKSIQELLPGYLPNLPFSELSPEDQEAYQIAYHLLGTLVEEGIAEVSFVEDSVHSDATQHEAVARPRFRLHVDHGKQVPESSVGLGGLAVDILS